MYFPLYVLTGLDGIRSNSNLEIKQYNETPVTSVNASYIHPQEHK